MPVAADMRMRLCLINALALLALAIPPTCATAHLVGFRTRAVPSSDGKFLLVSLMPVQERQQRDEPRDYDPKTDVFFTADELREWQASVDAQKAIEAKYSQGGLYRNDGSTQLLWPMPYISMCQEIFVANDGMHVVAADGIASSCSESGTTMPPNALKC